MLHRIGSHLGRSVQEVKAMPASEYADWQAFFELEPSGESAMDVRFEALRMDMIAGFRQLAYVVQKSATRRGSRPKAVQHKQVKIFDRGLRNSRQYMTAEEVNKRMRRFASAITGKKV